LIFKKAGSRLSYLTVTIFTIVVVLVLCVTGRKLVAVVVALYAMMVAVRGLINKQEQAWSRLAEVEDFILVIQERPTGPGLGESLVSGSGARLSM